MTTISKTRAFQPSDTGMSDVEDDRGGDQSLGNNTSDADAEGNDDDDHGLMGNAIDGLNEFDKRS